MGNSKEKEEKDNKHFTEVKVGLKNSFENIKHTLDNIKDWDELINLKEESIENVILKQTKTIKDNYSTCTLCICIFFGLISSILQLICVQGCIIILNSLFDEIVEEFKFLFNNTQREYNFYELLEINSYKKLPEIDVAMITSSVGVIFLKNSGFICSNITFQFLSLIGFLLIFLLFDFHKDDGLLENYTGLEIVVLVLSYVGLSFLVGCSSTISLKEFTDKYYNVYNKETHQEKSNQGKDNQQNFEKLLLFLFSGISITLIIPIFRIIFISYEDITSKWKLIWIIIICFGCFLLSMIFYGVYLIPISAIKEKIDKIPTNNFQGENTKDSEDKKIQVENKEDYKNDVISKINTVITEKEYNNNKITEMEVNKENQISAKNNGIIERTKKGEQEEKTYEIYSTKICTLCGYIYIRKESVKKSQCICYYYTSKCNWFSDMVCNINIILPTLTEVYCQVGTMGFNQILTEKLLNEYSYSKILKFYFALIILSIFFGIVIVYHCKIDILDPKEKKEEKNEAKKKEKNIKEQEDDDCSKKILYYYLISLSFLILFDIFTLISSACYYADDNITRERWNNIIMTEFILFKIIDFQILSFFNFYDNSDLFNTSLAITLEKLFWMIIEKIIDIYVENKKRLILVQIYVISIITGIIVYLILHGICSV